MKGLKCLLAITCLALGVASSANAVDETKIATLEKPIEQRAKVVGMTVELSLPDGSLLTVDNMDFCTPGNFYNGVQAVVFGDEAVRIMQAGMAALYPHVGDSINKTWRNKVSPDDPRLPTFLMIRAPQANNNKTKSKGETNKTVALQNSSAKVMDFGVYTPMIIASCGGYNHPPN